MLWRVAHQAKGTSEPAQFDEVEADTLGLALQEVGEHLPPGRQVLYVMRSNEDQ